MAKVTYPRVQLLRWGLSLDLLLLRDGINIFIMAFHFVLPYLSVNVSISFSVRLLPHGNQLPQLFAVEQVVVVAIGLFESFVQLVLRKSASQGCKDASGKRRFGHLDRLEYFHLPPARFGLRKPAVWPR